MTVKQADAEGGPQQKSADRAQCWPAEPSHQPCPCSCLPATLYVCMCWGITVLRREISMCVCVCAISEGIWLLMPCTVNEGDLYVAVSWVDATRLVGGVVFMRGACSSAKSKPLCRVESR
jgi:hypothetical protein